MIARCWSSRGDPLPPYLRPGYLLTEAALACLWMLALGVTPIPLVIATTCAGAAVAIALGNLISSGHAVPPEDRR